MPKLSIIVPYVNEYPQVMFTLRNLGEELLDRADFEIIAVNNFRINNEDDIKFYVNQTKKNDPVDVLVNRNGILRSIQVFPQRRSDVAYTFEYFNNRTKQQERTFNIWLGSSL